MAMNNTRGQHSSKVTYAETDGKRNTLNLYEYKTTKRTTSKRTNFTTQYVDIFEQEVWPFFTNIHYFITLERRDRLQKHIYVEMKHLINNLYNGRFDGGLLTFPPISQYCHSCVKHHYQFKAIFQSNFFQNSERYITTTYLQFYKSTDCTSTNESHYIQIREPASWSHVGDPHQPSRIINQTHMMSETDMFSVNGDINYTTVNLIVTNTLILEDKAVFVTTLQPHIEVVYRADFRSICTTYLEFRSASKRMSTNVGDCRSGFRVSAYKLYGISIKISLL